MGIIWPWRVHPVAEVAVVHFRGRNGTRRAVRAVAIAERFVAEEEECLVAAVVEFGDPDRAADRCAEIVLLVDRARNAASVVEEVVCVERFVANEVVCGAVELVGARLRREAHDAAGCLPVLGFEPVRVDRELGHRFD